MLMTPLAVFVMEQTPQTQGPPSQAAAVYLGDRLFRETRFAQAFFAKCGGEVNASVTVADPTMQTVSAGIPGRTVLSPYRGLSMNCRHCHLGDDLVRDHPLLGRTYCDFGRRSAIPQRLDGLTHTSRNSPGMVGITTPSRGQRLLHWDGEVASIAELVIR